jgi:hypothetical protein
VLGAAHSVDNRRPPTFAGLSYSQLLFRRRSVCGLVVVKKQVLATPFYSPPFDFFIPPPPPPPPAPPRGGQPLAPPAPPRGNKLAPPPHPRTALGVCAKRCAQRARPLCKICARHCARRMSSASGGMMCPRMPRLTTCPENPRPPSVYFRFRLCRGYILPRSTSVALTRILTCGQVPYRYIKRSSVSNCIAPARWGAADASALFIFDKPLVATF